MANRYRVTLTKAERAQLTELTRSGKSTRDRILAVYNVGDATREAVVHDQTHLDRGRVTLVEDGFDKKTNCVLT